LPISSARTIAPIFFNTVLIILSSFRSIQLIVAITILRASKQPLPLILFWYIILQEYS
jgi:hypothetical protein